MAALIFTNFAIYLHVYFCKNSKNKRGIDSSGFLTTAYDYN